MTDWAHQLLTPPQAAYVEQHLGAPTLIKDMSWELTDTRVLHVRAGGREFVVKASGAHDHHIQREITAHESYTEPLIKRNRTARLVASDRGERILITEYQPGQLAQGTSFEHAANVHVQAGSLLRSFHNQHARVDTDYESRATAKALAWLDREHHIAPRIETEARRILRGYRPAPIVVVPTHGDWQPRNWLIDSSVVRVIDFGRFDFRPAATDLCRLAFQQWNELPALEAAFLSGYGDDPRNALNWPLDLLREAIGTAVWASVVGDLAFEDQGHRMLSTALSRF